MHIATASPMPMATQLVSNMRCQQATGHEQEFSAAYRERGRKSSPSNLQSYAYHRIRNSSSEPETNLKQDIGHAKRSSKQSQRTEKLHQLGFSYLASSFCYILRKVKAFYKGFLGESGNESVMGSEASMAEPCFSIPVLPN